MRFPEFTDEWKEVLFASNLERLENGANYNTNDKDGVPMSRIETISTGRIDYTKVGHCSTPQKIEHYIMRYGDILFSHINSLKHIGKTAYYSAEEPLYHGMNLLLFRCKNNVDSKFFFFLINNTHFIRKCQILAKQAVNQASISTSDLKKIKVYIPDINEQSKIQKFLSLIEKRIELQNKIIDKLETLIKGIRNYVLNNKLQNTTKKKLGELCTITTGKLDANAMKSEGLYPFFTCAEEVYRIDSFAFDTEALLVSGNGANLGYIHYYKGKFNAYQRTYVLSNFTEDIHYIQIYLEAYLHKRIALEKSTSNTPYIVLATLAEMPIIIPNIKIQKDISNKILILKSKLITEIHIRNCYKDMRQFLLSQMFM